MKRGDELGQIRSVKTTAKRRAKSEAELLDQATNNLARSLKRDTLKKNGRIDYDKLRKEGDMLCERLWNCCATNPRKPHPSSVIKGGKIGTKIPRKL